MIHTYAIQQCYFDACCCIKWNSATNTTETNYKKRSYNSIRTKLSLKPIPLNTTRTYHINVR